MNNINYALNFGILSIPYLVYFYLMNKIAEKREFNYWHILNYSYILIFSIVSTTLSDNLYIYLFYFTTFIFYSIIFYRDILKAYIVNSLTFYLIQYLSIYLVQTLYDVIINMIRINFTYYTDSVISIALFASSVLILFIITKLLLTKLLIDDGSEFTNNQFAILLFPSIVGFISLYMFTNYSNDQNNLDISSILLALATVCVVFILVYLANIKTLHAKEKTESALREREKFLQESMDIQYSFNYAITI